MLQVCRYCVVAKSVLSVFRLGTSPYSKNRKWGTLCKWGTSNQFHCIVRIKLYKNTNFHGYRGITWMEIPSYQYKNWDRGPCAKNRKGSTL